MHKDSGSPVSLTVEMPVRTWGDLRALVERLDALNVADSCSVRWDGDLAVVDTGRGGSGPGVADDASERELPSTEKTAGDLVTGTPSVVPPVHEPEMDLPELADLPEFDWPSRDRARAKARAMVEAVLRYGDTTRPE